MKKIILLIILGIAAYLSHSSKPLNLDHVPEQYRTMAEFAIGSSM